MNKNHLALFHAVAETGSVSRAAERLHISQPAVSKQIAEFERALGTVLFDRLPRGVRLTESGELLAGYARRLFAVEADAERALAELAGMERGRLLLGASTSIGSYLLPAPLAAFHRAHPAVTIDLQIGNTEQIQTALEAGALDIGFTEGFVHSEQLEATVFAEDELIVIAAPGSPLLLSPPATLERLVREPFVGREPGSGTRAVIEQALADHGITLSPALSLGGTEAVKRAVATGVGFGIVSRLTAVDELESGRLAAVLVEGFAVRRPLHRLLLRGRHVGRAARAFLRRLDRKGADAGTPPPAGES